MPRRGTTAAAPPLRPRAGGSRGAERHRSGTASVSLPAGCLLVCLACLALGARPTFVIARLNAVSQNRVQRGAASSLVPPAAAGSMDADDTMATATEEERAAAGSAYIEWADQFPIAAARRDFYGLSCTKGALQTRFLFLARSLNISAKEAFDIFRPDLWVLCEPSEKMPDKLDALREVASSEAELFDFLRAAPRAIGTTTATEIRERGILNMRVRAVVGDAYELLISPLRFMFKQMARATARSIEEECETVAEGDGCDMESLQPAKQKVAKDQSNLRDVLSVVLFGGMSVLLIGVTYYERTYGGYLHRKVICPASPWPSYNVPDAAGNTGVPCNCVPVYKWYLEPQGSSEGKLYADGKKLRQGFYDTPGGCVWTAEDLAKDPTYWDDGEKLYWEKRERPRR